MKDFNDFLEFKRMITPFFIKVLYIFGTLLSILAGIVVIVRSLSGSANDWHTYGILLGFVILIGGPLLWRIFCESLILFFRMNETLTDINQELHQINIKSTIQPK